MTGFEHKIRESLENYSVPNETPDWELFEQKLDDSSKRKKGTGFIAAAVIGLIAGLAFVYNANTQGLISLLASENSSIESISATSNQQKNKELNDLAAPSDVLNIAPSNSTSLTNEEDESEESLSTTEDRILSNPSARLMLNDNNTKPAPTVSTEPSHTGTEKAANYIAKKPTEVIVSKKVSCIDEEVQFTTSDRCDCSYAWNFGDGNISYDKMASHTYESEGTYRVAVTITARETRKSTFAYRADVKVSAKPIADFEITQPDWGNCETNHQFISTSVGANKQKWLVDGEKLSDVSSLDYTFFNKGYHEVTLSTENSYGCKSSYSQNINIENEYNLGASNAFTPNNDGYNDEWLPAHLQCMNNEFSLVITNMQSLIVFQTNSAENKWDGTIKGSTEMAKPGETYAWTATYIDNNGITRMAKGAITIPSQ
jgi:gliding motility-associated-like protein